MVPEKRAPLEPSPAAPQVATVAVALPLPNTRSKAQSPTPAKVVRKLNSYAILLSLVMYVFAAIGTVRSVVDAVAEVEELTFELRYRYSVGGAMYRILPVPSS